MKRKYLTGPYKVWLLQAMFVHNLQHPAPNAFSSVFAPPFALEQNDPDKLTGNIFPDYSPAGSPRGECNWLFLTWPDPPCSVME